MIRAAQAAALFGATDGLRMALSLLGNPKATPPGQALAADFREEILRSAPPARFWTSLAMSKGDCSACHESSEKIRDRPHTHKGKLVKCLLCANQCVIMPDEVGKCRSRKNINGELRSLVYGRPMAVHVDPIEKKPFYHYLPGSEAYSLATSGCPLRCKFCQNWQISQASPEDYQVPFTTPPAIVDSAISHKAPVIAFTYNEPTVFAEYLIDIARQGRKKNISSVLVSCGFMTPSPLKEMCEVLGAIKIDLKGYSEPFYREVCSAELKPVLRSIKQVAKSKTHLEIVNLVVPTLNDSDKSLQGLADWVVSELGPQVPVHFTRFHPAYQMQNLPPTPVATLERARAIAFDRGIHYPYIGNVPGHPGNHTYCPACRKAVIRRVSFFVTEMNIKNGHCTFCGRKIDGVWG
ncbi:MAG TPA: AmmeMemoRadiSam system radical SAM enzyme [Thermodesulfobacteriota bacterium]|nr:AmmeMemoRadiSam system radical SAM enzyme [Thermodesulfobacteriota bacterium]